MVHLGWAAVHAGEWEFAASAASEGARLARDTRQPQYGLTGELICALVPALRGAGADFEGVVVQPERVLQSINADRTLRLHTLRAVPRRSEMGGTKRPCVISGRSSTKIIRLFIGSC